MNLKSIYTLLDIFFGAVWGFTIIDIIPLVAINGGNIIFSNLDNGIKVVSALFGLIYFAIRIYFYYHKSKGELSLLREQTKDLELKNLANEMTNFLFRNSIDAIDREEFEKSKERLKEK